MSLTRATTCQARRLRSLLYPVMLIFGSVVLAAQMAGAQMVGPASPGDAERISIRTESPRDTFETFRRLSAAMQTALLAYLDQPSFEGVTRLALLSDQMNALLDLDAVPVASRREVGIQTMTYLMDIFARLDAVDPASLPDVDGLGETDETHLRIPGTPLYIDEIPGGARRGEHLFAASSVDIAPRFFRSVQSLPPRWPLDVDSLTALGPQLAGPLFPPGIVRLMPAPLKRLWLGTPIWKVLLSLTVLALLAMALAKVHRLLGGDAERSRLGALAMAAALPLLLLAITNLVLPYLSFQVNLSGRFAAMMAAVRIILAYLGYAWLFWLAVRFVFEWIIRSPHIPDRSLDANLLRLVSGVIGIVGVCVILAFGGQAIGLPILSVLAGLGIGGLAVALALRPTLENLIGGVLLYIDRPVRVGDFCQFGERMGTVENIGVRSTTLRALDRTLISVPNAQFADMQIVNFAHCDRMLINETLGVRYDTTPDQLRYLLAGLRRMLFAHPRIEGDSVRVRFSGYGDYALNINVRVYALTREWNDFFAIREDVFLRIYDVVTDAGASFAFPTQTLHLARDGGPDRARREAAEATVESWRQSGSLPFPRLTRDEIERLAGTLDYPPHGSAERYRDETTDEAGVERLSAASVEGEEDEARDRQGKKQPR